MRKPLFIALWLIPVLAAALQDFRDELKFKFQHYTDNNGTTINQPFFRATKVLGPQTAASIHGVVDAITSASRKHHFPVKDPDNQQLLKADAVTAASPRETRREAGLNISQRIKAALVSLALRTSGEKDYQSTSAILGLAWDFFNENTTLSLGYSRYLDQLSPKSAIQSFHLKEEGLYQLADPGIGKGGDKTVDDITLNWTQVFTPRTIGALSWSFTLSDGYLGNPYRYVLAQDTLPNQDQKGGTFFHESRPDRRVANAIVLQMRQHYPSLIREGALHMDYRYSFDTWGLKSHTVAANISQYLWGPIYLQFGYRYYRQSSARFYRDGYNLKNVNPESPDFMSYMTVDPKLSELSAHLIRGKIVLAMSNFYKPGPGHTVAFFPTRLEFEVERYFRSTHKDEAVRIRRYEFYDEKGLRATTVRGGIVFEY